MTEQVWAPSDSSCKEGVYWYYVVIVVHDGVASLQATDIDNNIQPQAPEGRVSYGYYWPSYWWRASSWKI